MADGQDWEDVPAPKKAANDEWEYVGPQTGTIQVRKGGQVYKSPEEAAKSEAEGQRAGIEAFETSLPPEQQLAAGAVKGALHTGRTLGHLATKLPWVGPKIAAAWPEAATGEAQEALRPHGLPQQLGYGGEQAAEFMVPGGAVERGAKGAEALIDAAKLGPWASRAAKLFSKAGLEGLSAGAVNKAQGGSFGTGAALGAGGEVLGAGLRAAAPKLAESALGVTAKMRGRGRTIGEAALNELPGTLRPATIEAAAKAKLGDLTSQLEAAAAASKVPTRTDAALKIVDDAQREALKRNNRAYYDQLHNLREQLTKDVFTGDPLPKHLSASEMLYLKRGIGDLEKTWNPEQRKGVRAIVQRVYGALDKELDRAVPESAALNQRISSLIPVRQRSEILTRGADIPQRIMHRMAAHTGALAGSGIGSYLGYKHGGAEGALVGGTLGLAAPELLASPTTQMLGARILKAKIPPPLARAARGAILRAGAPSE